MIFLFNGFMGAGKSSFLKKIQLSSNNPKQGCGQFYDLDQLVVEVFTRFGHHTVSDIIRGVGWQKFREVERDLLKTILLKRDDTFLAVGGGALEKKDMLDFKNRDDLFTIWIDTPFETCLKRIKNEQDLRPLVAKGNNFLEDLYMDRVKIYELSDFRLSEDKLVEIDGAQDLLSFLKIGRTVTMKSY